MSTLLCLIVVLGGLGGSTLVITQKGPASEKKLKIITGKNVSISNKGPTDDFGPGPRDP